MWAKPGTKTEDSLGLGHQNHQILKSLGLGHPILLQNSGQTIFFHSHSHLSNSGQKLGKTQACHETEKTTSA